MKIIMKKNEIIYFINCNIICFLLFFLNQYFSFFFQPEGIIEIFQNFLLFSAILISFYLFILKKLNRKFFLKIFFLSFFIFLEEISYGQKIFEFSTPSFFLMLNTQKEFNLHNLKLFPWFFSIFLLYILFKHYILIKDNFLHLLSILVAVLLLVYLIEFSFSLKNPFICEEIHETLFYYTILHVVIISKKLKI